MTLHQRRTASSGTHRPTTVAIGLLLWSVLWIAPATWAETVIHHEDFTSLAAADTAATTALWDTASGELRLHPQGLATVGSLALGGTAYATAWKDSLVIVAAGAANALLMVGTADPAQPVLVHTHALTANARHLLIAGNWGYVSLGSGLGIQVVDLTNPLAPVNGTRVDLGGFTGQAVSSGTWLYTASYNAGVGVIEVTDPANPVALPGTNLNAWVRGLAVANNHLYLGADNTVTVLGLTNPGQPDSLATVPVSGTVYCVSTAGTWVYAGGPAGLDILDASQPAAPVLISSLSLGGGAAYGITVQGDSLFVANGSQGLSIVDITDPYAPQVAANVASPNYYYHTLVHNGLIWASNGGGGLQVLRADPTGLDPARNVAVSTNLNPVGDPVTRAQLTSVQSDSIHYELTDDGGATWTAIAPDGSWLDFPGQGTDLRWRATLIQTGPAPGPICHDLTLTFERLHSYGEIISAQDVPGDAGGWIRLRWRASRHDAPAAPPAITEYSIYRRFNAQKAQAAAYPPGNWEYLLTVPADQETTYAASVPSYADSSGQGANWTFYFVRARTASVGSFYDSPPDSGYSIDNLAPLPPTGFSVVRNGSSGFQLNWDPPTDPTFAHFRLYRASSPAGSPSPATLYQVTTGTSFFDTTAVQWYYWLTLVTFSGLESPPAITPAPVPGPGTAQHLRFAAQNYPNPFNPLTHIRFTVPPGGRKIQLAIYDFRGQLVATLVDGFVAAGEQAVTWRGVDQQGRSVASGLYTCRLVGSQATATQTLTLLR